MKAHYENIKDIIECSNVIVRYNTCITTPSIISAKQLEGRLIRDAVMLEDSEYVWKYVFELTNISASLGWNGCCIDDLDRFLLRYLLDNGHKILC